MRENEKDPLHQFDIWCANKNLAAAAKKKPCQAYVKKKKKWPSCSKFQMCIHPRFTKSKAGKKL